MAGQYTDYVLEVHNISKHFGGLTAVDNVSYFVGKNEIKGLIGPNGAGKTTLFNLITGYLKPNSGKVYLNGVDITGDPPDKICRMGLSRTFQLTLIFPDMTVYDCIWVGLYSRRKRPWNLLFSRIERKGEIAEKVEEICHLVGLESRMDEVATDLSYGDQKILEIAMALSTDPVLLLLDEPTQGVSPKEAENIVALIERLSQKMSIVLIEHDIDIVMRVCRTITVLNFGKVVAEGSCEEIASNSDVQKIYLGVEGT
jgi:branched-chain amino acid transport system ATP-binding protein